MHNGPRVLSCNLNNFKLTPVRNLMQVTDSITWVRCASGNVCSSNPPVIGVSGVGVKPILAMSGFCYSNPSITHVKRESRVVVLVKLHGLTCNTNGVSRESMDSMVLHVSPGCSNEPCVLSTREVVCILFSHFPRGPVVYVLEVKSICKEGGLMILRSWLGVGWPQISKPWKKLLRRPCICSSSTRTVTQAYKWCFQILFKIMLESLLVCISILNELK